MKVDEDDGFRAFVEKHWGPLARTAYLLTGDRSYAEDLVQTALEKAHRKWSKVAVMESPVGYVYRTMVNTATSWRRRRSWGEVPQLELPKSAAESARADVAYERIEQRHQLSAALRRLPPKMRAVLVLRYFEDLSEPEVAAVMGCSVGTVKSQASRGLQRLREHLKTDAASLTIAVQGSRS